MRSVNRWAVLAVLLVLLVASGAVVDATGVFRRTPILMYHSVGYSSKPQDRLVVTPETFAWQLKYLREHGFRVIPLRELLDAVETKRRQPRNTVVITFDDGFRDNFTNAFPILEKERASATIFVTVGSVGRDGMLTWDQILSMDASGLVDIESHTVSHPWLTGLDTPRLRRELEESRDILEAKLGRPVRLLCYPMGAHNEAVETAAAQAGYRAAFTTKSRCPAFDSDLFALSRIRIAENVKTPFKFGIRVSGYWAAIRAAQNRLGSWFGPLSALFRAKAAPAPQPVSAL